MGIWHLGWVSKIIVAVLENSVMAYFEFHHLHYSRSIFKVTIIEDDELTVYRVKSEGFEPAFNIKKVETGWNIQTKGLVPDDPRFANVIGKEIEKLDPADMNPEADPNEILGWMLDDDAHEGLDWTLEEGGL